MRKLTRIAQLIFSAGAIILIGESVSAEPPEYEFTSLFSRPKALYQFSASYPTINDSGVVSFIESRGTRTEMYVIVDDGTMRSEIDLDAALGYALVRPARPFINDFGAIAVLGQDGFSGRRTVMRFNPDGTTTTLATEADIGEVGHFISMNNVGQVAADARLLTGESAIVIFGDTGIAVVDVTTATRFNFGGAAINDSGIAAYKAQEPLPDFVSIFSGDGSGPAVKSLPMGTGCGGSGDNPDINSSYLIAGGGPGCAYIGSGGVITSIIVDSAAYPFPASTHIRRISLNDNGQVLFHVDSSSYDGLFFGGDLVNDKLLEIGDELFGETVAEIRFGGNGGLNDSGQIVFQVTTLSDSDAPTSHIVRANPVSNPDTDDDGVPDDVDNCVVDPNPSQADNDLDGLGDECDPDDDNDTFPDSGDNCPLVANDQTDSDGDGAGDECDTDDDNDNVIDASDQCLATAAGEVVNGDGCSVADLCPCTHPGGGPLWRNHGSYLKCVSRTSESFVDQGLISEVQKDEIVSSAAKSSCGK